MGRVSLGPSHLLNKQRTQQPINVLDEVVPQQVVVEKTVYVDRVVEKEKLVYVDKIVELPSKTMEIIKEVYVDFPVEKIVYKIPMYSYLVMAAEAAMLIFLLVK